MRRLYCYSHQEFNDLMEKLGWENKPENGVSTISISSNIDEDSGHWFNIDLNNNINLDFNDVSPTMWWGNKDYYDEAFSAYLNFVNLENCYFNFISDMFDTKIELHAMNYDEAFKLVEFIDKRIKVGDDIFVHCSAGASRSQAIVRYILDTYTDIEWETRKDNPCITPNWHVVQMLKRSYRYKFMNYD